MDAQETIKLDLGSIDFTPAWARKAAGVSAGAIRAERTDERAQGDKNRREGDRKGFAHDRKGQGGERRPQRDGRDGHSRFQERPKPLDVDVKVLPESKALGTIIRKLQSDYHAYKLKDLAYFLLDNPASVLLKVTPKKAEGAQAAPALGFHQCKACSYASTKRDDVVAHALAAHMGDYYESKEIEVEPPKGNFNCVAKCGLTGVLLGPPNRAEFASVVREMIRTRFPGMSEADYRAKIEMVRDSEAIEEWRKGATKKTVYVTKGAGEGAVQLTREQAEAEFKRNMLENLLDEPKNLMITAEAALKSDCKPLVWAAKDALEAERRAPYGMIFALRGAFHHRKLHFFRANDSRGPEFVVGPELKAFDSAHAVPELARVAAFIAEHPCQPKNVIAPDPETEKQLAWLASTGHVVAFTNGVYSAVEKFPKYGPQWQKKLSPAAAKAAPAPEAEAVPAPAPAEAAPEAAPAPEAIESQKSEVENSAEVAPAPEAAPAPEVAPAENSGEAAAQTTLNPETT